MKKFDFVIGNPPYHEETDSDSTRKPPVYDKFMEAAYKVGEKVELITPAKFLFNAGYTPKDFNRRMLNDPHLKVLDYAPDARKYFKGVDIKGGVVITLRDETKNYGAIETFTRFVELNTIQTKVVLDNPNFQPLSKIMRGQMTYRLSAKAYEDFPDLSGRVSERTDTALRTNAFEVMPDIFLKDKPNDGREYLKILGRIGTERVYRFVRREYMEDITELNKYKVFVPASNGSGALGEVIPTPLVGSPLAGATQTFITVGAFDTRSEADACLAYIKSKFCRAMLGILKVTQHNPPQTWAKVPLQDFTAESDIDWSGDVDAQLYRKYGLDDAEINFIETHVKAMT
jgi:type II restriction enzyme